MNGSEIMPSYDVQVIPISSVPNGHVCEHCSAHRSQITIRQPHLSVRWVTGCRPNPPYINWQISGGCFRRTRTIFMWGIEMLYSEIRGGR